MKLLQNAARGRKIAVVQLINRRFDHSSQSKDYEFSRATVRDALGRRTRRRRIAPWPTRSWQQRVHDAAAASKHSIFPAPSRLSPDKEHPR